MGPGIGQYFMLHDQVINLSVGAGSNSLALDRLQHLLTKFQPDSSDTFYWIVTSPDRCRAFEYFLETENPISALDQCLNQALARASALARHYSIEIKLIGGLCDLHGLNIDAYPNLQIAVESWGELLLPNYAKSRIDPIFWQALGERIDDSNVVLKKTWVDHANAAELKYQSWEKMQTLYFSQGSAHPDRHAHRVLASYLFPEWKHKYGIVDYSSR